MGVPLRQQLSVGSYLIKQKLQGVKHYPLVLMLEHTFFIARFVPFASFVFFCSIYSSAF